MDNIAFENDENLPVMYTVKSGHDVRCVAYKSALGTACSISNCPVDTIVPVYGWSMPNENMDDVNMQNVQLAFPSSLVNDRVISVRTDHGDITVFVQGPHNKPSIITYHDLGLNHKSFENFFNRTDMRGLMEKFSIFHINAPGQEPGAPYFPEQFNFPTMNELANQINYVLGHFGIKTFIGIGVGAGANILARFALINPLKVDALCLIDCSAGQASWVDWVYQKLNVYTLRNKGLNDSILDYLMWYHFGRDYEQRNPDHYKLYRGYFARNVNPTNLAMFTQVYNNRTDLGINRKSETLRVPVLNVTGAHSLHVDDTVDLNGRLLPSNSTWMKISDCAMVLEEQPAKISEAFRLFLQGQGFVTPLSPTKIEAFRRVSDAGLRRSCRKSSVIRITENPIAEAVVC